MAKKQFARSTSNRVLGGVLGGIADYFGWDANIVRLVFIVSILAGGVTPWLYLLAWIFIPNDKQVAEMDERADADKRDVTPDDQD
ncbi:PspC domain-containing protein [Leuconostocaceae bacterium ESL0723]|nr:PspC domain-containing protein [Lactobacillaceae bacterium L1_55_11]WEV54514.1 PspC domain-containing protein [Leuconostocaceae bacterium ESL0723]